MYLLHKTIHPPTAIDNCLYSHFYSKKRKDLVVSCKNVLKIYRLVADDLQADASNNVQFDPSIYSSNEPPADETKSGKAKLECLQTFKLHGQLVAIESISFPGSFRDSIILAFSSGKLSIVEYDPTTHDLKTISLHYFEDDDMKDGRTQFAGPPLLRVDPEGRCAAFLIYDRNIVIIPFRKEALIAAADGENLHSDSRSSLVVKSPVMSSYKLNLTDELYVGEKINNIHDIQFLESYNEPTLLILHEPVRTWSGRLAVRQDTCAMVALSLNIEQKVHPIIWSIGDLPYDCYKAVAVPKPVGGVLIIAVNSLSYLNQSVPPYAVSLNGFNVNNTSFPLIAQKGVKLSLDACRTCFISNDKLLVVTKSGDLYILTLFNDGMRSIRQFHFQKAASSVIASCVSACDDRYVFLGSRLGNSLLLRYTEGPYEESREDEKRDSIINGSIEPAVDGDESDEPSSKKIKMENEDHDDLTDWMAKDIKLIAEDDLEVYGETHDEAETLPTVFSFQVCDSIANIGPCSRVSLGEPAFMLSEDCVHTKAPQIELLTNSGWGKSGALSLLQRTIRPQIVLSQKIDDCVDMWTVFGPSVETEVDYNVAHHSYLIISENDSTTVCEAGAEIKELAQSGFSYQTRTILAGNLGNNQFIVQVTPTGVKLLRGSEQIHYLPMEVGATIDSASLSDPYVILLSKSGIISQVVLKDGILVPFKPKLVAGNTKILTACIYKDVSGLFITQAVDDTETNVTTSSAPTQVKVEGAPATTATEAASTSITIDDEDELLYGETTVEDVVNFTGASMPNESVASGDQVKDEVECKIKPVTRAPASYWLFVGRDNGTLQVYSIPDYNPVYYVKNFPMMPKVLVDSGADSSTSTASSTVDQSLSPPVLQELLVIGMGIKETRPILFARFNEQVVLFEAFRFHETQVTDHLKVRFKKLDETVILRPISVEDQKDKEIDEKPVIEAHIEKLSKKKVWLRSFADISGYSGVFLCGIVPSFFLMSQRGVIRRHEMTIDGVVVAFSSFHNVNCSRGFVYVNQNNDLRISLLPTQVTYDSSWPLRRIPLKTTVHHIKYHCESRCYILVTSVTENFNKIVRVAGDEKDYDTLERDDRSYIWPTYEKFSIELFSPVSWDAIAGTRMDFEEWEHVTCLTNVSLASEETKSGLKGYLAVGTNYCYGEDVTNRGRIWILDIIDVVPEPGMPLTRNKIKTIYCKEQKGPVTALCQVKGFLLSAIGQKIYIWQLEANQLVGVAFIDTQIYIQSAYSIKNLILVSDVYKSISLLRYQEETRTLALVSRDTRSFESYGCQYLIDHNQLAFVVFDVDGNLIVYSYSPEMRESHGGTRLIRKTEFHLGSQIIDSFRIKCVPLSPQGSPEMRPNDLRQLTVYAALDGSLGYLLPTTEKTYRRLQMLQNIMTSHLPHLAGLNPKAYRLLKTQKKSLMPPNSRIILDGDLLFSYTNLSLSQMYEIARKIGTTTFQIIDDLNEINRTTAHF